MPMMALVGRPPACDGGGELRTHGKGLSTLVIS